MIAHEIVKAAEGKTLSDFAQELAPLLADLEDRLATIEDRLTSGTRDTADKQEPAAKAETTDKKASK